MVVDFKKLREANKQRAAIDPLEIFRRLPKSPRIKDLYGSQAEVLAAWFDGRNKQRDHVIKLHTGGGKTLVGLLVAQSILNETSEPVLVICPNNQLVQQTLDKAEEYSISADPYEKGKPLSDDFLNGKSVLIGTYSSLFNGLSKFGVRGRDSVSLGGIIVDDAHVGSNVVRDSFTIRIKSDDDSSGDELYRTLASLFRQSFKQVGRLGTFDDVLSGADYSILEVPYWAWKEKLDQVQALLRENVKDRYEFQWPFLRDNLTYCHCMVSKDAVVITPILPFVDLIPSFSECKHRVFMSATIPDDSEIVRAFEAEPESLAKPLTSKSLAGVSERMILAPELMTFKFNYLPGTLRALAKNAAEKGKRPVILVPSGAAAKKWQDVATYADSPQSVQKSVEDLVAGTASGPYVFANRYDGIDLPDGACRLLILNGLPKAAGEYELFRANAFAGASALHRAIAQKIEQGMGRAARGPGDYCVVIVAGSDLVAWLGKEANLRFLTTSTDAQLQMGVEISKNISKSAEFVGTMNRCLGREKDWVEYHAETLAELTLRIRVDADAIEGAETERRALQLWRDGYHEKAIAKLTKRADQKNIDKPEKGWLLQLAARIALDWGKKDQAQELQQRAFAQNRNLTRALASTAVVEPTLPGPQAQGIVARIGPFRFKRGYVAEFENVVSFLVPESTANQFEGALCELGNMLGFEATRPEDTLGTGPDVLWIISKNTGLIIEAKSRKNSENALTKEQHGQLLVSENWFKQHYSALSGIRVSVHPSVTATKSLVPSKTKALTLSKLNQLVADTRALISALCESGHPDSELSGYCENLLKKSKLTPDKLVQEYLVDFEVKEV